MHLSGLPLDCSLATFRLPLVAMILLQLSGAFSPDLIAAQSVSNGVVHAAEDDSLDWSLLKQEGAQRSRYLTSPTLTGHSHVPEQDLNTFETDIREILERACFDCHGPDTQEGNVRIDTLDPDLLTGSDVDWWLEIQSVVSKGEMPPPDEGDLSDDERGKIVLWLSNEIQTASILRQGSSEATSFRRLTRYEYNHALQDLLNLPWNFAADLPPESRSSDGFENSSETLHMSVSQLETYRRLSRKALSRAIAIGPKPETLLWQVDMTTVSQVEWQKQESQFATFEKNHAEQPKLLQAEKEKLLEQLRQPLGRSYFHDRATQRNVAEHWEYSGARYALTPKSERSPIPETSDRVAVLPGGGRQKITIELGDRLPEHGTLRVRVRAGRLNPQPDRYPSMHVEFGWQASNEGRALLRIDGTETAITATSEKPEIYEFQIPLGEIYPRNNVRGVSALGSMPSPSEYIRLVNSSASPLGIQVDYIEVEAPFHEVWPPESHQKIFGSTSHPTESREYAGEVLERFMTRAWRRPISESELQRKLQLFDTVRPHVDHFEQAVLEVLASVLAAPDFLYVAPVSESPNQKQLELATRLSLFLWTSLPDQELLDLAQAGQLENDLVVRQQIHRMLQDPRSHRFADHFVDQWLDLELLEFLSLEKRRGFDPLLAEAIRQEPVEFFQAVLKDNLSVMEFLHSDFAMVNERLARHYGISGVWGNHFRKVPLADDGRRGGLLVQAATLAMNSAGSDSHPLKRGVWILESLLNDPPPPPPPAVPQIDLADPEIAKMTLKQRIENHRDHPACYACHAKIDPWGIALENYDALGRWREKIGAQPVDASSQLWNRKQLDGVIGLKRYLLSERQDQFARAMVYKLATYGLGRPLTFQDHAQIDTITAETRERGDGLATMIEVLVTSNLFQE